MSALEQVAVLIGQMSEVEVRQVFEMARRRLGTLEAVKVAAFRPGMRVSFTARDGCRLVGTVSKLNQRTASVDVETIGTDMRTILKAWRVSPSLLTAEEAS